MENENNLRASLIEAISLYMGWEESAIAMVDDVIIPIIQKRDYENNL